MQHAKLYCTLGKNCGRELKTAPAWLLVIEWRAMRDGREARHRDRGADKKEDGRPPFTRPAVSPLSLALFGFLATYELRQSWTSLGLQRVRLAGGGQGRRVSNIDTTKRQY